MFVSIQRKIRDQQKKSISPHNFTHTHQKLSESLEAAYL